MAKSTVASKISKAIFVGSIFSLAGLSGCASSPPGCDAPETVKTMERLVMDVVVDAQDLYPKGEFDSSRVYFFPALSFIYGDHIFVQNNKERIGELHNEALQIYKIGISTELLAVTSEGYDKQARKHTCKATLQMTSDASNQVMTTKHLEYSIQATAEKDGFIVVAQELDPFIKMVTKDAADFIIDSIKNGLKRWPK